MAPVGKRANIIKQQLLGIRIGPGAAILPPAVTRIHLDFATRGNEGHYGPRRFWKDILPRLKFWNPAVPMIVNRTTNNAGPATLSIYFREKRQGASEEDGKEPGRQELLPSSRQGESQAPDPRKDETVVRIDVKNTWSADILKEFMKTTKATKYQPTQEELAELDRFKELSKVAEVDRETGRKRREAFLREKRLLAKARQEADELKNAD